MRSRDGIVDEIDGEALERGFGLGVGVDRVHGGLDGGSRDPEEKIAVALEGFDEDMISVLLPGGGRNGLIVDAADAGDNIGDLKGPAGQGEFTGIALIAVGVAREEDVGHDSGLLADGVDVGEHGGAGRVPAGGEGRVVGGEDECLAGAAFALGRDGLEGLEEPGFLSLTGDVAGDKAGVLGSVRIERDDLEEGSIQQVIDAGLVHGLAVDRSGDRWDDLRGGAKVGEEGAEGDRVGGGEDLAVVVAGDRDNLAGVVDAGLVKLGAVLLVLVDAVDDVAEMEEEGG